MAMIDSETDLWQKKRFKRTGEISMNENELVLADKFLIRVRLKHTGNKKLNYACNCSKVILLYKIIIHFNSSASFPVL